MFEMISAAFRGALFDTHTHQGVSDPSRADQAKQTATGVAHALVSMNHDPRRALSGRHRTPPIRIRARSRKSLHGESVDDECARWRRLPSGECCGCRKGVKEPG